ncbi:MAG TPA: hypothetical protein VFX96_17180 [Pyrinomonadaceae bacterium]|nr:hypothetical protein [Pyrinomonadaceae bacterium]
MSALTGLRKAFVAAIVLAAALSPSASSPALAQEQRQDARTQAGSAVAWRDPGDISTRNLSYGPGSQELAPQAPFTFVSEDKLGASPKFKVTDARGVTWSVKLGVEAQTETVATRVVWSMGYFAEESYYLDRAQVVGLPKLSRGQEFVEKNGIVRGARFEPRRGTESRAAQWDWEENPFVGTRQLNGLKVLMALLGNYDNRPENNLVLSVRDAQTGAEETRYIVSDIGATLGKVGGMGGKRSKNNLEDFRASKFVTGVEGGFVKFDFSTKPKGAGGFFAKIFNPGYAKSQAQKERVMKNIPVEDARWIGTQLSQLSDDQLRDAFRAAGYDNATMDGYVAALRSRINQLVGLPSASTAVADAQSDKR